LKKLIQNPPPKPTKSIISKKTSPKIPTKKEAPIQRAHNKPKKGTTKNPEPIIQPKTFPSKKQEILNLVIPARNQFIDLVDPNDFNENQSSSENTVEFTKIVNFEDLIRIPTEEEKREVDKVVSERDDEDIFIDFKGAEIKILDLKRLIIFTGWLRDEVTILFKFFFFPF
jgi:hypothetical protein